MKNNNWLICGLFLSILSGCSGIFEKCKDSDTDEFEFELLAGGKVEIYTVSGTDTTNVTAQFKEEAFKITFTKHYCDGEIKGPFDQDYYLLENGELVRTSIGSWSYRMDNDQDNMQMSFFLHNDKVGDHFMEYGDLMIKCLNGTVYLEYLITIFWDPVNEWVIKSNVKMIN